MSTLGERKCALLLASLGRGERRRLLERLPTSSAKTLRSLIDELQALKLPLAALADELLADEVRGLTERTSMGLEQLVGLSQHLPAPWFVRVLSVWAGVDHNFCLAMLERDTANQVKMELEKLDPLPAKLVHALRAEAASLAPSAKAAA